MKKYIFSLAFIILLFAGCSKNNQNIETTLNKDLHYAVRVNNIILARELVEKVDINKKDEYGYTPLHLAAKFNHIDIAKILISKGAEVQTQDKYFDTPLIDSTREGYSFMSELLICNGAKVNVKDEKGTTAYAYAIKANDLRTAKLISSRNIQEKCIGKVITPNKPSNTQFYNQISIDKYEVLKDNTPMICGDIHDEDVRRIQISFDSGETAIEANIQGKRWCAQVGNELFDGYYRVDAISVNSINERGLTSEDLEIKAKDETD